MVASSASSSADSSQPDPYAEAWARLAEAILESPGVLPSEVRRSIADGREPPELAPLLDKVRRHAFRVTDADLAGVDVDTAIESVLAAALAEGELRRAAALAAIG